MNWNKTFTYSGSSGTKLEVSVRTTSTSVANNTTNEKVVVKFVNPTSSYHDVNKTATLVFNGKKRTKSFSYHGVTNITMFDFTQTVTHNNDGKKTVNLSISDNRDNMPFTGSVSVNENIVLDAIPREATITSVSGKYIGDKNSLVYSDAGGFATRVRVYSGTKLIKTLTGKPATITYTQAETNAIYNTIPNSNKVTLRFQLESNIGGTLSYKNFNKTLEIKAEEVKPIFTDFDFQDINAITTVLTGDTSKMIKSYSKMEVKIPASKKAVAQKGASITRYVITTGNSSSGDISYSTTADKSYTFNNVLVNTVRVTAYDSRKLETTVSKTFVLINYTNPVIENAELSRINGVETTTELDISGKFDKVNFGAVQNIITSAEYRRRIGTGEWSAWTDINALITYNTENGTFKEGSMNTITGFDFGKEYEVEIRIGDKLKKVTTTLIVNNGRVLLSYDKENHRIGIGTVPFGSEEGVYNSDKNFFAKNKWFTNDEYIMDLGNSDIIGANAIAMNDESNSNSEGILFLKQGASSGSLNSTDYETLRGYRGNLYYDNNKVRQNNILQLGISGNTIINASPRQIDNWVEDYKIGSKLLTTSTGAKIGSGVSMIKVSAYVAYRHLGSSGAITTTYLRLYKNGNLYKEFSYNKVDASVQSVAMIIPEFIMPVSEGDIIGLTVSAGSTSRYDSETYMNVEVIE